jgi:hypothetical protein
MLAGGEWQGMFSALPLRRERNAGPSGPRHAPAAARAQGRRRLAASGERRPGAESRASLIPDRSASRSGRARPCAPTSHHGHAGGTWPQVATGKFPGGNTGNAAPHHDFVLHTPQLVHQWHPPGFRLTKHHDSWLYIVHHDPRGP